MCLGIILSIIFLLISEGAFAAATVPGGGGNGQVTSLNQLSGDLCEEGEGLIWLSGNADCQTAVPGSGDSVQVAGSNAIDVNLIDSSTIDFSLNATPNPDEITAIVINASIGVAKLSASDFGDWTCNGTTCTIDGNAIALGTDTTGNYVRQITNNGGLICAGCNGSGGPGEDQEILIGLDNVSPITWLNLHDFSTNSQLKPPSVSGTPVSAECDEATESRKLLIRTDAAVGQAVYVCRGTAGWELQGVMPFSVDGNNVTSPNIVTTSGDISVSVNGSNLVLSIKSDAVALGTDTTNNYVATMDATAPLSSSGCTAGEGAACTVGITANGVGPAQIDETVAYAFPILNGKQKRNTSAVDDDDCTNEQGLWWYDSTDSAFEFCNGNSGAPMVLGQFGVIPTGTAPTVNAAGAIGEDTTATQPQLLYGAAPNVLSPLLTDSSVIEALTAADDNYEFWMAPYPVTIKSIGCRCRGTCTTAATFTLEDRAGNAMTITGTNPTCATTGSATFAAVTAGGALVAGEGIAFDVTNTPDPATDIYTITINYTIDRQ